MGSATSIIKLSLQSNQYEQGLRGAKRQFEDFTASIGINMKKMTAFGLAAGAAASAINGLTSAISTAISEGTRMAKEMEGVRAAFKRLDQPGLLDNLRDATHGTVNDLELMKQAVKFDNFNLSLEQMGTMLAFAQQQAKDTGQDVGYLVDSIVTGLGRKSLPILDNLGLSATEIKDRMKETGDMTKAVADIIQERMAAAGGYVETAADRSAKATADLENAMTSLGETFEPLIGASDSLWTSIKIGAINALNTAVKPLIQALSEAGALGQGARATAGFGNLGGNSKVDRMIGRLGNGKSAGSYSIYKQQLAEFDKYINNKQFQIAAYGGDNSSVAQSAKAKLQTELDGALKMRAEYVKRAQELSKPVDVKIDTKGAEQNVESLKMKLIELEAQRKKAIAAGDTDLSKSLAKQISQVKSDIKGLGGTTALKSTSTKNLPEYHDFYKQQFKSISGESLKSEFEHISPLEMFKDQAKFDPENILGSKDAWEAYKDTITESIGSIDESMNNLSFDGFQESYEKVGKDVDKLTKSAKQQQMAFGMAGQAAENLGAALSSMDDPAARAAGTVISAIANIALGFGQAVASAGSMGPWAWLAYVAAGTAALATTISTVHSLTGYAQGGIVKGNSYSGDNIYGGPDAMVNAGELVLTKAQQGNLASQLQEGGMRNMNLSGRIRGTDIILSVDRTLSLEGKQLLTWGR